MRLTKTQHSLGIIKKMEKTFTIRRAKIEDLDEILRLNFELFKKENKEYDPGLNLDWTYGPGKKIFSDSVKSDDNFVAVAVNNNKIVGYLRGSLFRLSWKNGCGAELDSMFVEEKYRNQGIGKQLGLEFIEWCKQKKIDYIAVRASEKNKAGMDFYKQIGFKDYDIVLEMKLNPANN